MTAASRRLLVGTLVLLFLVHQDFWLWDRLRWVAGLPAGFIYHVAFCLLCAAAYALVVRHAWPGRT